MDLKNTSINITPAIGVIGSGSFGTVIANLLAENNERVFIYTRSKDTADKMSKAKSNRGQELHPHIIPTNDIDEITSECNLIYPCVPSNEFRPMMRKFSDYLRPHHILIHCTKGFDIILPEGKDLLDKDVRLKASDIFTMSQVIAQESSVIRIGCLSGPNLSKEIAAKQPAATVIASKFDEVIREGQASIRSKRFQVYGSNDLLAVELGGILKNTMAIAAGGLGGMGYGQNALAFLISRGLSEIVRLGVALGAQKEAFLGLAGIGDLIATCTSPLSRNYLVGQRLANGESLAYILETTDEVTEGVYTVSICKKLADNIGLKLPIINIVYKVLFEGMDAKEGLGYLMDYRWGTDVDFM